MKIGLGTAQFGMDYGISNSIGRVPLDEVKKIIELAWKSGIRLLDTAPLYGDSENILGQCIDSRHQFDIVTKTLKFNQKKSHESYLKLLESSLLCSLEHLRQEFVYAVLLHDIQDLLRQDAYELIESLKHLQQKGLIKKIGVSIYETEDIDIVLKMFTPDIVQLPINVFNQTFLRQGYIRQLKQMDVEIYARSVFLQGLLLMKAEQLPTYFDRVRQHIILYQQAVKRNGLSLLEAALGYVCNLADIDKVLCGVTSVVELKEIIDATFHFPAQDWLNSFFVDDKTITNPKNW